MGGHGGLNILPQKSWNVYGRENRLKVARDEAKHREEEDKKREKHMQAERDHKRQLLLQRAAMRDGVELAGLPQLSQANKAVPPETYAAALVEKPTARARTSGHVNFFEEFEAREMHPEVVEEKKNERRRRGNVDTQTSDAKFDERFKFGFGHTGKDAKLLRFEDPSSLEGSERTKLRDLVAADSAGNKPWYSRPKAIEAAGEEYLVQLGPGGITHDAVRPGKILLITGSEGKQDSKGAGIGSGDKQKKHKKHKDKKKTKGDDKAGKKSRYDELRGEREERELEERARAAKVELGRVMEQTEGYLDKRYHGAFGVAILKRQKRS